MRWLHLVLSIAIIGYLYGPVADLPEAVLAIRFVSVPVVILSGLWMWKGHLAKKLFRNKQSGLL